MRTCASVPPPQPVSIYPDTGHHHDGTPRVTDQQGLAACLLKHSPGLLEVLARPSRMHILR
jgi:hypothetical protein